MKEFNLELAKAGHPVQTRDGRPVRILCYDAEGLHPIVGLVTLKDKQEHPYCWTKKGVYSICEKNDLDLVMATTKREGWINIYKSENGYYTGGIYPTLEEAIKRIGNFENRHIETKKLEWEE